MLAPGPCGGKRHTPEFYLLVKTEAPAFERIHSRPSYPFGGHLTLAAAFSQMVESYRARRVVNSPFSQARQVAFDINIFLTSRRVAAPIFFGEINFRNPRQSKAFRGPAAKKNVSSNPAELLRQKVPENLRVEILCWPGPKCPVIPSAARDQVCLCFVPVAGPSPR